MIGGRFAGVVAIGTVAVAGLVACARPSTTPTVAATAVTCPPSLASPDAAMSAPPLPDNVAVGRGMILYAPGSDRVAWLITESGTVYSVPPLLGRPEPTPVPTSPLPYFDPPSPQPVDPMFGVRLSPDGRWLVRPEPGHMVIRDLTSTRQLTLGPVDIGAWSDDGSWAAITTRQGAKVSLDNLDTGATIPVRLDQAHALWQLNAIFGPHEVLLQRYDPNGDQNPTPARQYVTIDPADNKIVRQYTVDFDSPGAKGHVIAWTTQSQFRTAGAQPEIILGSLDSGHITARYPLPSEDPRVEWYAERVAGDHVILLRSPRLGDPTAPADPVQFFSFDPLTGARQATCALPPQTHVILRG